ncbi:MAG: AAA family ATPase [Acidobacteriota bacterium]
MKISQAETALARCVEAGLTVFLHAQPGTGKSKLVERLARASGVERRTLSLSLVQPEDIRVPVPTASGLVWRYAEVLPREGRGILFLDEFPQASETVQSVFGQLLYQGRLDEYELPPGWVVVCAGNRVEDRAAAHAIPTQIRNRVVHIPVETTVEDWADYDPDVPPRVRIERWPQGRLEDGRPHPLLKAMLKTRPDSVSTPSNWRDLLAWPSPRTLSMASAYMAQRQEMDEIDWAIVAGLIGEPAAAELRTYAELRLKLPTLEDVKAGRAEAGAVTDPVERWVAAFSLAEEALQEGEDAVGAVIEFCRPWGGVIRAALLATIVRRGPVLGKAVFEWKAVIELALELDQTGIVPVTSRQQARGKQR